MKRNLLLFLVGFFFVAALKYAFGQEDVSGVSWDPVTVHNPMDDVLAVMIFAPIVGFAIGIVRVLTLSSARPVLEPIRLQ